MGRHGRGPGDGGCLGGSGTLSGTVGVPTGLSDGVPVLDSVPKVSLTSEGRGKGLGRTSDPRRRGGPKSRTTSV